MCDRPDEVAYRWDDFAHAGWRAKAHYDKHGAVDMVVLECKTNDSFQPWRAAVIERSRRLAESFRLPDLGDALNRVITDVEARIVWPREGAREWLGIGGPTLTFPTALRPQPWSSGGGCGGSPHSPLSGRSISTFLRSSV